MQAKEARQQPVGAARTGVVREHVQRLLEQWLRGVEVAGLQRGLRPLQQLRIGGSAGIGEKALQRAAAFLPLQARSEAPTRC